ncbi:hypothetical protein ACRTAK_002992 [Clostridium perfringens]
MDDLKKKEVLCKEIDLIQSCINRMAQNSFIVKGWFISLIAVILTLLPEKFNINYLYCISFIISFCFWYLDAFFLKTERLYRFKYQWVITERLKNDNYFYDLNPYNRNMWYDKNGNIPSEPNIIQVMFSKTLLVIYLPIIILIIILIHL